MRQWGWDHDARVYVAEHGLMVRDGPFAGMRLPTDAVGWEQCAIISWLRGSYERELHDYLTGPPGLFVDIGSAEGTYLVGMALRGWRTVGFEIDPVRRRRARTLAELNDVSIEVHGEFDPRRVDLTGAVALIDIEGAERDLIPRHVERFAATTLIVEFHEHSEREVVPTLERTHQVTMVPFVGRDAEEAELRSDDQAWGVFRPRCERLLMR